MADVIDLLQAGLTALTSGQLPDANLIKALVSKVLRKGRAVAKQQQHVKVSWLDAYVVCRD